MTPILEVSDLHYTYPDGHVALNGVGFDVAAGEKVALLGPNGAGKTTLALHLNGIRTADSGTVSLGGVPITHETVGQARRQVGMVFQNPDDQLFMPSVKEDVGFGPANLGVKPAELDGIVSSALAQVGAGELTNRVPHHLSGGERRRVSLATVLAMEPDILVLDEPTSGLDPAGRRELIAVLGSLPMAQLVITHDLPFAAEFCDRALIMDGGCIVADGKTSDILFDADLLAAHRLEMPYIPPHV